MKLKLIKNMRSSLLAEGRAIVGDTRELSLAKTSMELARMHLGKVCHYLGEPYPYIPQPTSTKDIKPLADDFHGELPQIKEFATISSLRTSLASRTDLVWNLLKSTSADERVHYSYQSAMRYLEEARMWLGMHLANFPTKAKVEDNPVLANIFKKKSLA